MRILKSLRSVLVLMVYFFSVPSILVALAYEYKYNYRIVASSNAH